MSDVLNATQGVGYPCIVKPSDGTGSMNVSLAARPSEVSAAASEILSVGQNSRGQQFGRSVLVEQFIDGDEFAVQCLSIEGTHKVMGVLQYSMSERPYFVETGYMMPPLGLSDVLRDTLIRSTTDALDALEVRSGASECEIRIGHTGPYVIEVSLRHGGGFTAEAVAATSGIDYYRAAAAIACGATSFPDAQFARGACMRHIYPGADGWLAAVEVNRELPSLAGYVTSTLAHPGRRVSTEIRDYRSPVGSVLFAGSGTEQAIQRADSAVSQTRVEVDSERTFVAAEKRVQ